MRTELYISNHKEIWNPQLHDGKKQPKWVQDH